jgi:putative ABC transport system permease protein
LFLNYLVTALRNLKRNWLYASISIFGLAVSFAGAILVAQFVRNEFSYDRWIPGYEQIYKLTSNLQQSGQPLQPGDLVQAHAGKQLKDSFAGIVASARLMQDFPTLHLNPDPGDGGIVDQTFAWADPEIFTVFPLSVHEGDLKTALQQPDTVVMTRNAARTYFGREDVMGQMLDVQSGTEHHPMKVTAILEDLPSNTSLLTEIYASGKSQYAPLARMDSRPPIRTGVATKTFVRVSPEITAEQLQAALDAAGKPDYDAFSSLSGGATTFKFGIVPIAEAHVTSPGLTDIVVKPTGSRTTAYAIASVGALIVLIAGINFVTLMTARASRRAMEVGVRKANGARRSDLVIQFMGEALIYAILSMLLAIGLAGLLMQPFSDFVRRELAIDFIRDPALAGWLIAATVVIGFLGGLYPALVLSSFRPGTVLKGGQVRSEGSPIARQALVVVQFAILIGLIVSTVTIYRQTQFALSQGFGSQGDLIVQVWTPCNNAFPDEVRKLPGVQKAGCSSLNALNLPFAKNITNVKTADGKQLTFDVAPIDFDFFETFDIQPVAGRMFHRARAGDNPPLPQPPPPGQPPPATRPPPVPRPVILNETAVRALGFATPSEAVGKTMTWIQPGGGPTPLPSEIVGVTPDLPQTVNTSASPAIYFMFPRASGMLSIKTTGEDLPGTVSEIQRVWKATNNIRPIQLVFFSERRQIQYLDIIIQGTLIAICAAAAVVIACLGLFALSAFAAERRTKEIGIRKALGATTSDVLSLLMWQFTIPVLVAIVIALPVGYLLMTNWLQGYAYHVDLAPWTFALAAGVALAIAWLTVSFQTFMVARAKPVRALRYE